MAKIAVIIQPAGLGDILFTAKIRYYLEKQGYRVIHPVISEYSWIDEYIDGEFPVLDGFELKNNILNAPSGVTTVRVGGDDILLVPLQSADRLFDGSVMDAKYKLMGLDFEDWASYLHIKRNSKKEKELFNLLGLSTANNYVVVNNKYGSPPHFACKNIDIKTKARIVEVSFLEGFTLFDWIGVFEKAEQIHAVESSINYIFEKEDIDPSKVFVYSKHTPSSFDQVKHLFSKRWNYMY
jgi:hypothetical protein